MAGLGDSVCRMSGYVCTHTSGLKSMSTSGDSSSDVADCGCVSCSALSVLC